MNPVYSIIIPHRNTPELLRRLLDSIPRRHDTEVIIVDDCSDEPYQEALRGVRSDFPSYRFLSTPYRQFPAGARNLALQWAQGKYLIFADADDFFLPAINDVMTDYADCDYDLVCCNAQSCYSDSLLPADRAEYFPRLLKRFIASGNPDHIRVAFAVVWGRLIRRSLIVDNNIRFNPVVVNEDVIFSTLSGMAAKTIVADMRKIYCVTERPGSISKLMTREAIMERLRIAIERNELLRQGGYAHLQTSPSFLHNFLEIERAATPGLRSEALEICRHAGYSTWRIRRSLAVFKLRSALSRLLRR